MKTTSALIVLTTLLAVGILLTARNARPPTPSPHFAGLGDLPGGIANSMAYGVSADGTAVVGWGSNSTTGTEAFRWTRGHGMEGLGFPEAFATSADGSMVVGYRYASELVIRPVEELADGVTVVARLREAVQLQVAEGNPAVAEREAGVGEIDVNCQRQYLAAKLAAVLHKHGRGRVQNVAGERRVGAERGQIAEHVGRVVEGHREPRRSRGTFFNDIFNVNAITEQLNASFAAGSVTQWAKAHLRIVGQPGDFNQDNTVDAADYVMWRKQLGPAQHAEWRSNFGELSGSGAGGMNTTAPEPATALLIILAVASVSTRRRWWAWPVSKLTGA